MRTVTGRRQRRAPDGVRLQPAPYNACVIGDEDVAPTGAPPLHGSPPVPLGRYAVLVPVKSFAQAKRRLTAVLGDAERRALVRSMAETVLRAASPLPVAVVCDDPEVARWARDHGALVLWEPGRGLNGAVQSGVEQLAELAVRRVVVAHADLPLAKGLAGLFAVDGSIGSEGAATAAPSGGAAAVTLVPDRREDGTNVIELPTDAGFRFSYGPGSFRRHREECARLGLEVRVLREPSLSYDVDWPSDLPALDSSHEHPGTPPG